MSNPTLTIIGRLIGVNELINSARTNKFGSAKQKKDQMAIVTAAILQNKEFRLLRFTSKVSVHMNCYEKDLRRDVDNVVGGAIKVIMDSLVENGILIDDSRKYVSKVVSEVFVDKDNPRIEITLIE